MPDETIFVVVEGDEDYELSTVACYTGKLEAERSARLLGLDFRVVSVPLNVDVKLYTTYECCAWIDNDGKWQYGPAKEENEWRFDPPEHKAKFTAVKNGGRIWSHASTPEEAERIVRDEVKNRDA